MDAETQRYVDKSMETVRAQNDARFAEVLSRIDIVSVKIDHAPRPLTVLQFLLGSAGALAVTLGVVFAVLAYASDRFDGGLAATAVVDKITSDQLARDSAQDAKLDQIIEAVGNLQPASNSKP